MTQLLALIPSIRNDDHGQGLAEYALILALIAMVAVIALLFLGSQVSTMLDTSRSSPSDTNRRPSLRAAAADAAAAFDIPGRIRRDPAPCRVPCGVRGFLPFLPNGPSPLV